ncbi:MAG: PAS domain S-box protein [Desulfobacterales bacterium]|nr:PAS domain S-box protein [Desulfobacterales bacterium]
MKNRTRNGRFVKMGYGSMLTLLMAVVALGALLFNEWTWRSPLLTWGCWLFIFAMMLRWLLVLNGKREAAERAARESRERFGRLCEAAFEAIVIHDKGEILLANDLYYNMFGYEPHELAGEGAVQRTADPKTLGLLDRRIDSESPDSLEMMGTRKDGTNFPMEIRVRSIKEGGRLVKMTAILDLTGQKRARDELRAREKSFEELVDNALDGILILNQKRRLMYANRRAGVITGHQVLELIDMDVESLVDSMALKHFLQKLETGQEETPTPERFETVFIRKDGKRARIGFAVLKTIWRKIPSTLVYFRDITEARLRQERLIQTSKMIALGRLVSGVAHEINNPNNFIMLNIPLLMESWESATPVLDKHHRENGEFNLGGLPYEEMRENIPKLFSSVMDGANRIKRIVHNLKNFARQDSPEMNQRVDVNAVVKSAITLMDNLIKRSTRHFSVAYGEYPPAVEGNRQRLEQVVVNLIQNACQALPDPEGGIVVATTTAPNQQGVLIEVRDEGVGVPPDILPHIMDPFFTTRQDLGGTGLGLSVSSSIIEEHGGHIRVDGELSRGAAFTVFLPLTRAEKLAKVLVVDDDEACRGLLMNALARKGSFEVREASNGLEACIKLGTWRPDLIILDISMPEMNGLEVCRIIKAEPELSGMKAIITTGYPDSLNAMEIKKMGFTDICPKPVGITLFMEILERVLRRKRPFPHGRASTTE